MKLTTHPYHSGRKIVTKSKTSYKALSKSNKTGYVQGHESRLQHKFSHVFERDSRILEHYEEPEGFNVIDGDQVWKYYPDFILYWVSGLTEYIEIKPGRQLNRSGVSEHLTATGAFIEKSGFGFRVLTEKDLPYNQVGISNLRRLNWFRHDLSKTESELLASLPFSNTTFGELSKELGDERTVLELMALDLLRFDVNRKICNETVLSIAEGANHD